METGRKKGLPKSVEDMSKDELEDALRKKKECNARAQTIVEKMIENPVDKDWFLNQLKFLRRNHFQDIIEERLILRMCGYPLCCENLKDTPTHKYRISLKTNRVYDTSDRQKFCSNKCYQASSYLENQVPTSPLWFDDDALKEFTLMPVGFKTSVGVEIGLERDITSNSTTKEEFTSINQFAMYSLDDIPDQTKDDSCNNVSEEITSYPKTRREHIDIPIAHVSSDSTTRIPDHTTAKEENLTREANFTEDTSTQVSTASKRTLPKTMLPTPSEHITPETAQNTIVPKTKEFNLTCASRSIANFGKGKQQESTPTSKSPILHIEQSLHEWVTLETLIFLFGEQTVKDYIIEKKGSIKEYSQLFNNTKWDPKLQDRYEKICKRLCLMEMEDEILNQRAEDTSQLKPLPDYSALQEASESLVVKVNAFYGGKLSYSADPTSTENSGENDEPVTETMPLVDSHSQKALRRKLVTDRLSRVLSDWCAMCGVTTTKIMPQVRATINTFALAPHNITFKPLEWKLLGLIIIEMVAIKDPLIKSHVQSQQGHKYQTPILASFRQDHKYINKLIKSVTEIDNLLKIEQELPLCNKG